MMTKPLGGGTFPDVAYFIGRWYVTWQHGPTLHLVSLWPHSLDEQTWTSWQIGEPAAHPKLHVSQGRLWLAHRDGTAPYHVLVREIGTSNIEELSTGHGADPVALGHGDVAWQTTGAPSYEVWRKPLAGPSMSRLVRHGAPTGLSRVLADGSVTTVDEDRFRLPGYTRPCWAGDLTVAEGKSLGAYAVLGDGRALTFWPGEEAVTPRCAWDGADRYAIVTWGAREGVRIAEALASDFQAPREQPKPQRLPEGTEIDLLPFLVGQPETWPRDGDHYMHQTWDGRNLHFLKFGPVADGSTIGDAWERLVIADGKSWLREDRSQSGAGIYSMHEGRWLDMRMRVGQWIHSPDNILQRYAKDGCGVIDQHPFSYSVGLVEAWKDFDCGGDLGIRDVVIYAYDPGGPHDSIEFYWLARGAGWFQWREQRQDDPSKSHTSTFNRIGGVPLTPTLGCWRALQAPPRINMTIVDPPADRFPLTTRDGRVRCVAAPDGGTWAPWIEWIYRRVGEPDWRQWNERRDPRDDNDNTFQFGEGNYEIGVRWTGGQTGKSRVVRVEVTGG